MFCIAAFIVLTVISIFSVSHREMTKKAWYCVVRRITFKPCDINFGDELKGKILGKLIFKYPKIAKILNKSFDWLAFVFVLLSVWSLLAVFLAGLNLFVYDTCDPVSGEACSLSGEACGVSKEQLSFGKAVQEDRLGEYFAGPFITFTETVSRIPDRFKNWDAKEFIGKHSTFYRDEDKNKPYALEIIDPSCVYCKKLFENIKNTGFHERYNLTYIAYPIADNQVKNGFKFEHSMLITKYLEALKQFQTNDLKINLSPDWYLLEKIFTEIEDGLDLQSKFNAIFNQEEAILKIKEILTEIGYTKDEILQIEKLSNSQFIHEIILKNKEIVEKEIRTVKIPTIIFGGRRFDRLVDESQLK